MPLLVPPSSLLAPRPPSGPPHPPPGHRCPPFITPLSPQVLTTRGEQPHPGISSSSSLPHTQSLSHTPTHNPCRSLQEESSRIQASAQTKVVVLQRMRELSDYEAREAADLQVSGVRGA